MIIIRSFGTNKMQKRLSELKKSKSKLPKVLGAMIVEHFKKGFVIGGGQTDAGKWKPRKIYPGDKEAEKRSAGRAILVKSGKLKRSIRIVKATWGSILVKGNRENDLPYAEIHNEGGTIRQTVTPRQRAFFFYKYKKTKKMVDVYLRSALSSKLNIRIPKREFIGKSRVLKRNLKNRINLEFKKLFA